MVASVRGVFGIAALIKPRLMFPAVRLCADDNTDGAYTFRIFGSRESFVALAEAGAFGKQSLPSVMRASAAVDAADTVSYILAYRDGRVDKLSTALFTVVGIAAVALNVYAATEPANQPFPLAEGR